MPLLRIEFVSTSVIVFAIDGVRYYLQDGMIIYDANLRKLVVPNVDFWLAAQTHQRYSMRDVYYMATAFQDGVAIGLSPVDVNLRAVRAVLEVLLKDGRIRRYWSSFWVECSPLDLRGVARGFAENFDDLKAVPSFVGVLRRFLKQCRLHDFDAAAGFESLLLRLHESVIDPVYPETAALDQEIATLALTRLRDDCALAQGLAEIVADVKKLESQARQTNL